MEPQLPTPSPSPEQGPLTTGERHPQVPEFSPVPVSPERPAPQEAKQGGGAGDPSFKAPATPVAPVQTHVPQAPAQQSPAISDTPLLAADDDLIEKEWVEKAKKVIAETRHDPHLQEQAVSKLQADYLQKRYNKIVKVPTDG